MVSRGIRRAAAGVAVLLLGAIGISWQLASAAHADASNKQVCVETQLGPHWVVQGVNHNGDWAVYTGTLKYDSGRGTYKGCTDGWWWKMGTTVQLLQKDRGDWMDVPMSSPRSDEDHVYIYGWHGF